jgi:recombinational DNA repair ATPase RecF
MSRAATVLQGPTAEQMMMIKRAKLHSLEVRNYLGAGGQCLRLQLDGNHAVLCGPNGSGKTTLLSALAARGVSGRR